ncbi:MAG TPA: HD domain-containing protein [Trebonia sp.]|nr:HD domain-containing protein [Trebonia sp.]
MELFTDWHTWTQAEPELRRLIPPATADEVSRAVSFALRYHGDQRRPTGAPYLEHLLEALEVLVRGAAVTDPAVLVAAVLHDVVEDTACGIDDVRAAFGDEVASLVGWVTIPPVGPGQDRKAVKETYLTGLAAAPDKAVLVKLADRVSNVQTLRNLSAARQREYYAQTVRYIMPLAASRNWFADWYTSWQAAHLDLA